MGYKYPIYKKHTQLGNGDVNGTIYMEFVDTNIAICRKIDGQRMAYTVGDKASTADHTWEDWEDWNGITQEPTKFKIKDYK